MGRSFGVIWTRISDPRSLRSGTSREPSNPSWSRIHRFLWCVMIWVIWDQWCWSEITPKECTLCFSQFAWLFDRLFDWLIDWIPTVKPLRPDLSVWIISTSNHLKNITINWKINNNGCNGYTGNSCHFYVTDSLAPFKDPSRSRLIFMTFQVPK